MPEMLPVYFSMAMRPVRRAGSGTVPVRDPVSAADTAVDPRAQQAMRRGTSRRPGFVMGGTFGLVEADAKRSFSGDPLRMSEPLHASPSPAGPVCGLCGAALAGGRGDAVCASCLLGMWDAAAADECPEVPGYELLGELARGGMGVVYRARQAVPEREVALKVLLPRFAEDPEMLERFRIEARAMVALDHPGILAV